MNPLEGRTHDVGSELAPLFQAVRSKRAEAVVAYDTYMAARKRKDDAEAELKAVKSELYKAVREHTGEPYYGEPV